MTLIEQEIKTTLRDLDTTVKSMANANPKPDLTPIFRRLDELAARLEPGTDPNLRHYLQRKSYEKALLLLEGRDAENARGACR